MIKKKFFLNFTSTLGRIVLLSIIILFLINIGRSIYKNHSIKKQIAQLHEKISILENEKIHLQNRILYYQTDTYKEIESRKKLNYQKKGEKTIVLKSKESYRSDTSDNHLQASDKHQDIDNDSPNWQKWIKFIFG
jgi:cell division protein FtsB